MDDLMEKLVSLCKRRGFIFPSSEIYGGLNGCWDYGPLGVELKRNIKNAWWYDMVTAHDDLGTLAGAPQPFSMVGLDCSILMNPRVWEASGHVGGFSDPMVDCKECKGRFREDQMWAIKTAAEPVAVLAAITAATAAEALESFTADAKYKKLRKDTARKLGIDADALAVIAEPNTSVAPESRHCPACGAVGSLSEPRAFNLMFETNVGAMRDSSSIAYLRPETAQGIFVNFKNVCDTSRVRVPFGIAQIGKAFRNEINPRNFTFRSREFEQMEIEFFCKPDESRQWYEFWRNRRYQWYIGLGLQSDKLKLREHDPNELAHYAKGCADVEYVFPFGQSELEGIANRADFDLNAHATHSGKDMQFFDDQEQDKEKRRYLPWVIEPSAGADRATLAFLCEAYYEDQAPDEKGEMQTRVVMRFHPRLAPIKAAIFPLVKKDGMPDIAKGIYQKFKRVFPVFYDEAGAIGRRYRRQDEIGTPFCLTVDSDTLTNGTVTLRDRDTLKQERLSPDEALAYIRDRVGGGC